MLNFNKKKYVSFDNLSKFSGMIQKALSDKLRNVETNLNEKIDSRFKSLTAKEQGDSEVIDAREGQVSLSENLKTYVKKEEFLTGCEHLNDKFRDKIEEVKTDILTVSNEVEVNTAYINTNKSAIQKVIDFVDAFRCELQIDNTGYIKLPNVLGGLILQWGIISPTLSNYGSDTYIDFPVNFSNKVFNIQTSCSGKSPGFAQEVFVSAYNTNNYGTRILVKDKQHESPTIYVSWLAIGK